MSENVRTRKRARDIAIKIADQIEDEKQGVDPEDLAPLVPVDAATSNQPRKPWARRAALTARRRMEVWEDAIGSAEAHDCMESTAMLVLEHANFDSELSFDLYGFLRSWLMPCARLERSGSASARRYRWPLYTEFRALFEDSERDTPGENDCRGM
jgi:hypothetical protein